MGRTRGPHRGRVWLTAFVTGMAVLGCAPTLVFVKDSTQRVEIDGVSVLPPAGQTWYIVPGGSREVLFGRQPPKPPTISR